MKSYLPFIAIAVFFTSCSSVYRSGQTPDDVYFSPERPRDEYVRVERRDDRRYDNDRSYRNNDVALEDRYLRMKIRNRRYGLLDDEFDCYCNYGSNYYAYNNYYRIDRFGFYNDPWWIWNYSYNNAFNNPYYFNLYYRNPYFNGVVYGNVNPVYNKPRTSNLHVFDRNGNSYNPNVPKGNGRTFSNSSGNEDNYRNSGTNAGGFMRNVFGSGNNSSGNSSNTSSSSSNSGNSSGSSSSSGSSNAPVRKF